ncbi:hypothetical protein BSKO_05157 [Bryopsis sp. KO-2023]|nr:hypothetical protein BSKO_05157 [Bryopsis sp. KO-2023]
MFKGQVTDDRVPKTYEELVEPHVASFDYFLSEGIQKVVQLVKPVEIEHPLSKKVFEFQLANPAIGRPVKEGASSDPRLYPRECRERKLTYGALVEMDFCFGGRRMTRSMGLLPIMVKSLACHLRNATKSTLFKLGEEANDFGGYFVAGGLEKCLRIIISTKRDYIHAVTRSSYFNRGPLYTDKATLLRCVRDDEFGTTMRCHYLKDGTVQVALAIEWSEFFVPAGILLKALQGVSDREIFDHILASTPAGGEDGGMGNHGAFVHERAELLLHQAARFGLKTRNQSIEFLGSHFRNRIKTPSYRSDHEAGIEFLLEHVFCHLRSMEEKYHVLIEMIHKLYAFVNSLCCEDNQDALTTHEAMLPGIFFMKCTWEVLMVYMDSFKRLVERDLRTSPELVDLHDEQYIAKTLKKCGMPCKKLEMLIKTGNFKANFTKDLGQTAGFTVVAERINFCRFLAHFRAYHRGSIFVEMKTTKVRKLLPESWGFVCPVHTPDGTPCGLLLHFTADCKLTCKGPENPTLVRDAISMVLTNLGMVPIMASGKRPTVPSYLSVFLDGRVIGHVHSSIAENLVKRVRAIKAAALAEKEGAPEGSNVIELNDVEKFVPADMEVAYFPYQFGGLYPGISLFTTPCRPMRKVVQLDSKGIELIGPLEQQNLSIQCPDGGLGGSEGLTFTHKEVHTRNLLSVLAGMTPFSDFNQSPRNMYQCQMLKQTMGTPCQDFVFRPENKMYRLLTPQSPICRSYRYDQCKMDEYMGGTNAVVAVLAYTGYDMEDAMILNRSSVDRGFAHGSVYKTEQVFMTEEVSTRECVFNVDKTPLKEGYKFSRPTGAFGEKYPQNNPSPSDSAAVRKLKVKPQNDYLEGDRLDVDGLPMPGAIVWPNQIYYSYVDYAVGKHKTKKLKGDEIAIVDTVTAVGNSTGRPGLNCANIKLRFNRNPVIGDKFASRAGQKGILSQKWPDINFPFCAETGMRPDLIINPHAFPSRMTIGMLVESLSSKGGALAGKFVDCSPFQKCDLGDKYEDPVVVFGEYLEKAGYNRFGTQTMISGITGEEMVCNIYIGLVYYQRLRHMVSDKFQCRSTGPINSMTHQPVKGRKAGGGIRLGEMERDSLVAHGASYIVHDRLNTCSDYQVSNVCANCGSFLGTMQESLVLSKEDARMARKQNIDLEGGKVVCLTCNRSGKDILKVPIPYVYKLLVSELAAMNIKITLDVKASAGV